MILKSSPQVPDPDLFLFALAGKFHGYFPEYSKEVERTKTEIESVKFDGRPYGVRLIAKDTYGRISIDQILQPRSYE